jgi:hypothetical protein
MGFPITPLPGKNLNFFQIGAITVVVALGAAATYSQILTQTQQCQTERANLASNARGVYRKNPSAYHYLDSHVQAGIQPEKAILSLAHERPVFNKVTKQNEDFSYLLKETPSTIKDMAVKVEKNKFDLGQYIWPSYKIKTPVPRAIIEQPAEPRKKPTNRKVTLSLQKQSTPSLHLTVDDKNFVKTSKPLQVFYPGFSLITFSVQESMPVTGHSSPQIEVVESPYFISEGPCFFLHTEGGIILSFLIFLSIWISLLYFFIKKFIKVVVKYTVFPNRQLDILRLYSLREISYENAFYLLQTTCGLDKESVQSLLYNSYRPMRLSSQNDVNLQNEKVELQTPLRISESNEIPFIFKRKRKRVLNFQGWLVVGVFSVSVLIWLYRITHLE